MISTHTPYFAPGEHTEHTEHKVTTCTTASEKRWNTIQCFKDAPNPKPSDLGPGVRGVGPGVRVLLPHCRLLNHHIKVAHVMIREATVAMLLKEVSQHQSWSHYTKMVHISMPRVR